MTAVEYTPEALSDPLTREDVLHNNAALRLMNLGVPRPAFEAMLDEIEQIVRVREGV
jgi:hypothetical protein